ncbi:MULTISPECIES: hypothetical protein [unclassified Colwellia]|jgi:hypothetical protein|uniref:hypothetical protein n=1 Tax=unclassified Colwellia TaxID=196834 RepID=UPI0015F6F084|nr:MULTISPECIES: hypothetical protein [unclassified Colwellia]MBA6358138.1 hypothetical protein [Colwellia sp. BRX8-3]MBA6362061.1 hypothetical protein [Colwellia sp. BRX8-6]MBA6369759.1 hypothetical protein [Colwellia sp. BRX8-5]MBA6377463.1 hypothetical protein [Colwellia sp. BRX8-2]
MELAQINDYLSKLEGFADIESINANKVDVTGSLLIKFNGDTGSKDKGEIEIEFYKVEAMCISFRLLAPVKLELANDLAASTLDANYIENGLNFYQLTDDVGSKWWIYAKGIKVKLLPIFYG